MGEGGSREICSSWGHGGELRWTLQIVELRGPVGIAALPLGALHLIAGVAGPQIAIGPAPHVGLPKERVLTYAGPDLEFRRPALRAGEPSRVAVLSALRPRPSVRLVFEEIQGREPLRAGARAAVLRAGSLSVDGIRAAAPDALILPPVKLGIGEGAQARVLLVVDEEDAPDPARG